MIESFKSTFTDFLRPNLYAVYIFPKSNFAGIDDVGIGVLCHEAEFPFFTFNTTEVSANNKKYGNVVGVDYDPVAMTFYCDRHNKTLKFFDAWSKQIMDGDHRFGYYDDYISTIEIELIDRLGQPAAVCTLVDAYPVNINSVNLTYEQSNSVMSIQASFKFNDLKYTFFDRPIQNASITVSPDGSGSPGDRKGSGMYRGADVSGINNWKDFITLGNIRRGVNMISKIKEYRRLIEKPTGYDLLRLRKTPIFRQAKNLFKSGTSPASDVAAGTGATTKTTKKGFNIVTKASTIFKKSGLV